MQEQGSQLGDIRWMTYKSYINKYCIGYNWSAGITLLLAVSGLILIVF
jgi:hypothetical protein